MQDDKTLLLNETLAQILKLHQDPVILYNTKTKHVDLCNNKAIDLLKDLQNLDLPIFQLTKPGNSPQNSIEYLCDDTKVVTLNEFFALNLSSIKSAKLVNSDSEDFREKYV